MSIWSRLAGTDTGIGNNSASKEAVQPKEPEKAVKQALSAATVPSVTRTKAARVAEKNGNGQYKPKPKWESSDPLLNEIFHASRIAHHAAEHVSALRKVWRELNPGKNPPWVKARENRPPKPAPANNPDQNTVQVAS